MAEGYDGQAGKKMMVPPDPEERVLQIRADLSSEADVLEAEARDLEDQVLLKRARAAGLREGVRGLGNALDQFQEQMARRQEFMASRDGEDVPSVMPRDAYDAR